jgi:hypothetical protein
VVRPTIEKGEIQMTDNDIKKALEDLKKCNNNEIDCGSCTLSVFYPRCPEQIGELALNYINRLEAENERLNTYLDVIGCSTDKIKAEAYKNCFEKVKAEVESWTYNLGIYTDKRTAFERLENFLKEMVGE